MREPDELREERFRDLVQRQSRFVFRIAYAMLRNVQDAEDVVQEVFMKLFRSGAWEEMRDERAFLARTAWRMAVDRLPERNGRFSGEDEAEEQASDRPDPEQMAVHGDTVRLVHKLMDALPEELRQPLALSAVDEMSSKEIAACTGDSGRNCSNAVDAGQGDSQGEIGCCFGWALCEVRTHEN